jgi:hypothetical protein
MEHGGLYLERRIMNVEGNQAQNNQNYKRHVRLAYQPPASSTFLSEQISHQQPASNQPAVLF